MNAEQACDLCGKTSYALIYRVRGYPIVRCRTCGLTAVPRDPHQDLVSLYDVPYWESPDEVGYNGYRAAEARKRHHFRGLVRELNALVAPGKLLEIGSAYGFFLDEARQRGWHVRGVEPSDHAAQYARRELGLDILAGPFVEMPTRANALDAVVLWDVIEHLLDPRLTLQRTFDWLRPGGVIALSTGDIDSLSARIHGRDWSLLTPPWHQFFFSRRTLRRLLEDIGFSVLRVGADGNVAVDRASTRPRIRGPLAALLQSRTVTTLARKLNRGTIMFVYARKPVP